MRKRNKQNKKNKSYYVLIFKENNVPANEEPYTEMFLMDKELSREQIDEISETLETWRMAKDDNIPAECPKNFFDFGWHEQLISVVGYISKKYGITSYEIPYIEEFID